MAPKKIQLDTIPRNKEDTTAGEHEVPQQCEAKSKDYSSSIS